MKLDLYDFDKTVYPTDSATAFWLFCLVRYPYILAYLPFQLLFALLWGVGVFSTGQFKSLFLRFVGMIPTEKAVRRFWDKHEKKIYPWFQPDKRENFTVVISASPDFLLGEICRRLKTDRLICTKCDAKTGKILGENCKGAEKVRRLREELGAVEVEAVYSDNVKSDAPMFALGRIKYHTVNGEKIRL